MYTNVDTQLTCTKGLLHYSNIHKDIYIRITVLTEQGQLTTNQVLYDYEDYPSDGLYGRWRGEIIIIKE